ncbi:MAG: glycosyltransferase family 39 protein [Anaerolineae bacterium]|nr:glycosyltransferase family 39 protein [Anaerolineae bacterium]
MRYNKFMGKTRGAVSAILSGSQRLTADSRGRRFPAGLDSPARANRDLLILAVILLVYLGIGILYAAYTPAWQVPDEPAHYNYVRHLAETGRFPVLQMGDYPHDYLEELKARRFPPDLPIDPIRYESHQPPLYYLLAVPVYWLSGGEPLALRLLSVALGAGLLLFAYRLVRAIFPRQPALALGTAAFVAFLPMHVAMTAGVENDTLAELLLAAVALLAVQHVLEGSEGVEGREGKRGSEGKGGAQGNLGELRGTQRRMVWMGILLGLVLVTKTTAYAALPVALAAVIWRWCLMHRAPRITTCRLLAQQLLALLLPALLIALPWYARNMAVYGWPDPLGLRWHNAIVVGQPRTAGWIATYGWADFLRRFAGFSFKSFWGVFGWMGLFVDNRIYLALGLLSGVVMAGLLGLGARKCGLWAGWGGKEKRGRREKRGLKGRRSGGAEGRGSEGAGERRGGGAREQGSRGGLVLMGVWLGWTVLQYLAYNITFVQHQGRYLFPALVPIGLAFALGWREALRPAVSRALAALLALLVLVLAAVGLATGDWPTWPLLFSALGAGGLFLRPWLPRRLDGWLFALPFIGLVILDLICLFGFIVPALSVW